MNLVSLENLKRFYTKLKEKMYLKTEIDTKLSSKSDTSHTHDNRYYTESEIDTKIANAGKFYGINKNNVLASTSSNFTASADGWLVCYAYASDSDGSISVNGIVVASYTAYNHYGYDRSVVPVKAGDNITFYHNNRTSARVTLYGLK